MRGGQPKSGCGTVVLTVVLAVLLLGAFGAWYFGAIDRLLYLLQVESNDTLSAGQLEQESETADRYVYLQLNDDDKAKYLTLLDAFTSRESRPYPETDMDDLSRIRDCVLADHPELFYVNGVRIETTSNRGSGLVMGVAVSGQYLYSEDEATALQAQVADKAASCLAGLPADAGDYEKAKYLYEYLVATVQYDHEAAGASEVVDDSSGQTIVDALVEERALCAGYARAYQYLLQELGVPCVYVTGKANGGNHAWCAAYLDGSWYFVDPTWGDPQFLDELGSVSDYGSVNYDYLCVTDTDIMSTHSLECPYPLPACTNMSDNYYVHEGLYLDEPNIERVGAIVENAVECGEQQARFRCADRSVYDQLVESLFEEQEILRFVPGDSCGYVLGDALNTIEVHF